MRRGRLVAVVVTAVLAVVAGGFGVVAVVDLADSFRLATTDRDCRVEASGRVALDPHQMANAATIAAVGIRQQLPPRGVVVALATALQESKLRNLRGGDRDSLGLFQQRPSMGWGTPRQIRDPRYAARRFYQGLKKVRGWERMRVTDAAQRVQRSAFPEAYEKWVDEAQILTRALLGQATGAVSCSVRAGRAGTDTAAVLRGLRLDWGQLSAAARGGDALAVSPGDVREGWRYAHWLVAHAAQHGVRAVTYGGLRWTAERGRWARTDGDGAEVTAEVFPAAG
ncbi:MAG TPA: hypothetical protein VFY17_07235 [Pilimelia sp.]|nr:hypothetical protein [Pilimelia sp.]